MARRKKEDIQNIYSTVLSDKEILIAYCSTLSDKRCKKAYEILKSEFNVDRSKTIRLNRHGVQDDTGLLRLSTLEYEKILASMEEYKFHWLIACIYDYLDYLQKQMDEGDRKARAQFNAYTRSSIYAKLRRGWAVNKFNTEAQIPQSASRKVLSIDDIEYEYQALEYIQQIPRELLQDSSDVEYLATKYPKVLQYVKDSIKGL